MERVTVTKEFTWDMAHMLANHQGACENLHGHTYKMQVGVTKIDDSVKNNIDTEGMIVDFGQLKDIVKTNVIDQFDHSFIYWTKSTDPFEHELAALLKKYSRKVTEVSYRPTAEEMTKHIFNKLNCELNKINIKVINIKIWETPTSFAEIRSEI